MVKNIIGWHFARWRLTSWIETHFSITSLQINGILVSTFFQRYLHDKGYMLKLVLAMCKIIFWYYYIKWFCLYKHQNWCKQNGNNITSFSKHNIEVLHLVYVYMGHLVIVSIELIGTSILEKTSRSNYQVYGYLEVKYFLSKLTITHYVHIPKMKLIS